ncbi:hypothetical protein CDG76_05710 [Nostoc sp. 'Peltigera membranacea cyanobiont' 210A]|uniref:GUN4 domain-containing protein n=1 Tax=Nostoc sp. 'Peltigera membranacea cyanobiont' 210A TaxID=2014529 RepID=UPI000B95BE3A|nr:GUN4 domain-containing protein [Nostoc sp. 'Peltigera membranacea cyanobiont' 210A]OYD96308.1 hypothetical protein CDG76_05710 [Nostoc sp. 'Peltigera membranacea cyanobiont' 210A]
MDYTRLRDLLAAGEWKEANEETNRVILAVAGREKEAWLDNESIDSFPCEGLRIIDQLWVKYSNGYFGFSVQKLIYQSLGGTRLYDGKIWQAFCDRVGWRNTKGWILIKDVVFSRKAPLAHLPIFTQTEMGPFFYTTPGRTGGGFVTEKEEKERNGREVLGVRECILFFSRVNNCRM